MIDAGHFQFVSFPHTRGGGPIGILNKDEVYQVFPTRVGVDLQEAGWSTVGYGVFPTRVGVDRMRFTRPI